MKTLVSSLAILAALSAPASAGCRLIQTAGKCIEVEVRDDFFLQTGAELPDTARLVMNPTYYGLPRVNGDYRYYVVGRQVYRVDNQSLAVIDRVGTADRRLW
jgi:hypothetical protein